MSDRQSLSDRLGCRPGGAGLEEGLQWAARNGVHFIEFCADFGPDALSQWNDERVEGVLDLCRENDQHLIIHTLSGVNVAEFSPFLSDAVDQYLAANIDLAHRLNAAVIVHGGVHFSHHMDMRREASLLHLRRAVERAEATDVQLLFENLNFEPPEAEVHYLGYSVEELRAYFEALPSPNLRWAFVPNHAHLLPVDFDAFLDAFGVDRIGMVLIADCRGTIEEHLLPGKGTLDIKRVFERLESMGYGGPFTLTFGNREEKLVGREYILDLVRPAS